MCVYGHAFNVTARARAREWNIKIRKWERSRKRRGSSESFIHIYLQYLAFTPYNGNKITNNHSWQWKWFIECCDDAAYYSVNLSAFCRGPTFTSRARSIVFGTEKSEENKKKQNTTKKNCTVFWTNNHRHTSTHDSNIHHTPYAY